MLREIRENENMYEIIEHSKCKCGALTIELENVNTGKRIEVNFKGTLKAFKNLYSQYIVGDYNKQAWNRRNHYYNCNYCVNHWGLDLCGCGSGEKFGKCKENTNYCHNPAQSLDDDFISSCDSNLGA